MISKIWTSDQLVMLCALYKFICMLCILLCMRCRHYTVDNQKLIFTLKKKFDNSDPELQ